MNDGKICVSVCAESADELIEDIKRAAEFADLIELRLDCLKPNQISKAFAFFSSQKTLLLTFRPQEQGGRKKALLYDRVNFWNAFVGGGLADTRNFWIDCEYDLKSEISNLRFPKIISFHDFSGTPENLNDIYEKMSVDSEITKIAVQTGDVSGSIDVWKLLERAKSENKQIIPIAMGASGVWTRILGLAHGAFMTYAALESGRETAGGQLTAKELIETYRVRELDENTEIYGIVGCPVSHSVSPAMQNAAFKFHDLNAVFIPFEVKNPAEFIKKFVRRQTREIDLNFKGFSVTIPHKQAIIEFLDETDETAKKIGAVNTVKIENDRLVGYNTDARGFISPLKKAFGNLQNAKVAVIGAGGAARACVYALRKENAEVTIYARNLEKAIGLAEEFQIEMKKTASGDFSDFDIVVNASPLGMKGEFENETPALAAHLKGVSLCYDLVYNPIATRFSREAKAANVPVIVGGLQMLVAQGAHQFKIWTGKEAPFELMSAAALEKLQS